MRTTDFSTRGIAPDAAATDESANQPPLFRQVNSDRFEGARGSDDDHTPRLSAPVALALYRFAELGPHEKRFVLRAVALPAPFVDALASSLTDPELRALLQHQPQKAMAMAPAGGTLEEVRNSVLDAIRGGRLSVEEALKRPELVAARDAILVEFTDECAAVCGLAAETYAKLAGLVLPMGKGPHSELLAGRQRVGRVLCENPSVPEAVLARLRGRSDNVGETARATCAFYARARSLVRELLEPPLSLLEVRAAACAISDSPDTRVRARAVPQK